MKSSSSVNRLDEQRTFRGDIVYFGGWGISLFLFRRFVVGTFRELLDTGPLNEFLDLFLVQYYFYITWREFCCCMFLILIFMIFCDTFIVFGVFLYVELHFLCYIYHVLFSSKDIRYNDLPLSIFLLVYVIFRNRCLVEIWFCGDIQ